MVVLSFICTCMSVSVQYNMKLCILCTLYVSLVYVQPLSLYIGDCIEGGQEHKTGESWQCSDGCNTW